jgi:urease accessory protein
MLDTSRASPFEQCFQKIMNSLRDQMYDVTATPDVLNCSTTLLAPNINTANASDKDLQRADGRARILLSGSDRGTFVVDVLQRSPIRVLFPRTGGSAIQEAVLINTAGGIAGGDRLQYSVTALAEASIAITSQAAEKVYRALSQAAQISTKLSLCEGAKVAWLPQETIVFNWARLNRETEIELSSGAELLALEWLVLGRAAYGEKVVGGHIKDTWRVTKDARLIWADSFRITEDIFPHLHRKALLSNFTAIATLIYFGPDLEARLELMREIAASVPCQHAATLVGGVIVVRFAAEFSSDLRLGLRHFLQEVGRKLGDSTFRVPKMWAC